LITLSFLRSFRGIAGIAIQNDLIGRPPPPSVNMTPTLFAHQYKRSLTVLNSFMGICFTKDRQPPSNIPSESFVHELIPILLKHYRNDRSVHEKQCILALYGKASGFIATEALINAELTLPLSEECSGALCRMKAVSNVNAFQ
jgi:hypothetical protein